MADVKQEAPPARVLHGFHHENATPAAEFVKEKSTITMVFPRRVTLLLDNHQRIEFPAGTQEVPVELVEPKMHFYLEHNGVKRYAPTVPVLQGEAEERISNRHVAFLQSRGYVVTDVASATRFVVGLAPAERAVFFADAKTWTPDEELPETKENDDAREGEGDDEAAEEGETDVADAEPAAETVADADASATEEQVTVQRRRRRAAK